MWNSLVVLLSTVALGAPHTTGVVTSWQPTWSPDGKWVAYASDRGGGFDVWKTDGVHVRRVARAGDEPAWSPDGKKIALVAKDASTVPSIYLIDAARTSTGRQRVAYYADQPSWSPTGRRITFAAPSDGCGEGSGIWVMRRDGSDRGPLVESPSEFTDYVSPAWSPDGRRVAYDVLNSDQGDNYGIKIVDVMFGESRDVPVRLGASHPSWSPDGRRIVYVTPAKNGDFGPMFVVDLRTQRVKRLTRVLANGPAWSPGGKRIAFAARTADGSTDIYLVNPDGSHLLRLTKP